MATAAVQDMLRINCSIILWSFRVGSLTWNFPPSSLLFSQKTRVILQLLRALLKRNLILVTEKFVFFKELKILFMKSPRKYWSMQETWKPGWREQWRSRANIGSLYVDKNSVSPSDKFPHSLFRDRWNIGVEDTERKQFSCWRDSFVFHARCDNFLCWWP